MTHAIATSLIRRLGALELAATRRQVHFQHVPVGRTRLCTPPHTSEAGKIASQPKGCPQVRRTSRIAPVAPMKSAYVAIANASGGNDS